MKGASPEAGSLEAVGKFDAARAPRRMFTPEALAGAGALALLATASGLGVDKARSEPHSLAQASGPTRVDPLHWGNASKAAFATGTGAPAPPAVDAIPETRAARDRTWARYWTWARLGKALPGAGAIGLLGAALEALRRRRRWRKLRLETLFEVRDADDEATEVSGRPGEGLAPRILPSNPYLDPRGSHRLGRQIENAAGASLEFGRVLGVIFFDLGAPPADPNGGAALDWAEALARLVFDLRAVMRSTDHVALLDDRYVIVCIALLPGMTELIGIGERLRDIGLASPTFAAAFERQAGLSIFPLCGYRGDELIAYAREDFDARNARTASGLRANAVAFESARQGHG